MAGQLVWTLSNQVAGCWFDCFVNIQRDAALLAFCSPPARANPDLAPIFAPSTLKLATSKQMSNPYPHVEALGQEAMHAQTHIQQQYQILQLDPPQQHPSNAYPPAVNQSYPPPKAPQHAHACTAWQQSPAPLPATMQQQDDPNAVVGGPVEGSRGLGSTLAGAAHKVHKVELAIHHLAHPVQGLKYHTVGKLKRKVKAKVHGTVNHLVDKVLP